MFNSFQKGVDSLKLPEDAWQWEDTQATALSLGLAACGIILLILSFIGD